MTKHEAPGVIEQRLKAAAKTLEGKDLEVYRLFLHCEPYFVKQGEFKRYLPALWTKSATDPRQHKNWKFFERTYDTIQAVGCTMEEYLAAVFRLSYDDQITKRKIYPAMLASEWAIAKYLNWKALPRPAYAEKVSLDKLKYEAVLGARRYIGHFCMRHQIPETEFFSFTSQGSICPDAAMLCMSGVIPQHVFCSLGEFWEMYQSLDPDFQQEFEIETLRRVRFTSGADKKFVELMKIAFEGFKIV